MPDDAAARFASPSQAGDGVVNRPELLVTRHDLAGLAVHRLEHGEVADQVEQMRRAQHPGDEDWLAVQGSGSLLRFAEEQRRAGALGVFRSQRR